MEVRILLVPPSVIRRDGRAVYCSRLENEHTPERCRGFESHFLLQHTRRCFVNGLTTTKSPFGSRLRPRASVDSGARVYGRCRSMVGNPVRTRRIPKGVAFDSHFFLHPVLVLAVAPRLETPVGKVRIFGTGPIFCWDVGELADLFDHFYGARVNEFTDDKSTECLGNCGQ